jgi:hypothetical protein
MKVFKTFIFTILVLVFLSALTVYGIKAYNHKLFDKLDKSISEYSGDGELKAKGGDFISIGYELELEDIALDSASESVYEIDALPQIDKSLYFILSSEAEFPIEMLDKSYLEIILKDENFNVLYSDKSKLGQWRFASGLSNHPDHNWEIYSLLRKHMNTNEKNFLHVIYTPDVSADKIYGNIKVVILAGGSY